MKIGRFELDNIYNEDCYKAIKDLPDKCIDLVYIDIPYLIGTGGTSDSDLANRITRHQSELGQNNALETIKKKIAFYKEKMANAKTQSEYEKYHCLHSNCLNHLNLKRANITNGIDYSLFDDLVRVMKNIYIYIYIWCSKEQIFDIMEYFIKNHNCSFNILVWCKTNCVPATNGSWLPNIEYCLVFKGKGTPKYNDGYELKSKWYVSSTNKKDKDEFEHPTIKPLDLVKQHLGHSTNKGDVVLDCFIGSGTTAVACKELGRHFLGFEIDKDYWQIAVDRVNGITQQDRKLKNNGQVDIFDFIGSDTE